MVDPASVALASSKTPPFGVLGWPTIPGSRVFTRSQIGLPLFPLQNQLLKVAMGHDWDVLTSYCLSCGMAMEEAVEKPDCYATPNVVAISHIISARKIDALLGGLMDDSMDAARFFRYTRIC